MKIGIWLGLDIVDSLGGSGSYSNQFLRLIDNFNFSDGIDICYLSLVPQKALTRNCIIVSQFPRFIYRLFGFSKIVTRLLKWSDRLIIKQKGLSRVLKGTDVKIVCYHRQEECIDPNFPFISNNWDIGHRSTHAFPELTINGEFENRDFFYKQILSKSLLTICESEAGKNELIKYAGLGAHKIRVMPMFAGNVCSLCVSDEKMKLHMKINGISPLHYFYYPAQFWAHKNHIGLLKAFKIFKNNHKEFKLVFCGSDRGNKQYVIKKTQELGLQEDVVFLGFISEEEVYSFYRNAACLVMASHFGPTNMPPIEAMELGCPVACSDLSGHREILGDNAVYFNSFDQKSICDALEEVVCNRQIWVERTITQKNVTKFNSRHAMMCFNDILKEAIVIRENWE